MMDVFNIAAKAPAPATATSSASGSSRNSEGAKPKDDHKSEYAEAAENVEEAESDGKELPNADKGLPVSNLEELLADTANEQLKGDAEELDILQGDLVDGVPAIPVEIRPALAAATEESVDANLVVKKSEGLNLTSRNPSGAEGDLNLNKLELSLSQSGSKEQSVTEPRDFGSFDKRPMSAELKTVTQNRPEVSVPVKVGENGWQEGISQRVMMLISQRNSMARIHVNPPELGPVEVRLNVNHDQASVQFFKPFLLRPRCPRTVDSPPA